MSVGVLRVKPTKSATALSDSTIGPNHIRLLLIESDMTTNVTRIIHRSPHICGGPFLWA